MPPPSPHSKKIGEILIHVSHLATEVGPAHAEKTVTEALLNTKMDDYLFRLGRSNASVNAILLQLLTRGKVRVDFRNFAERLALADPKDRMTATQAAILIETYFQSHQQTDPAPGDSEVTHCFIAQSNRAPEKSPEKKKP